MTTSASSNRLRSYHFSLGDSTNGSVGYCARVVADSKDGAVTQLRAQLEDMDREQHASGLDEAIEYLTVYFNPTTVLADTIDEIDDVDDQCEPEEACLEAQGSADRQAEHYGQEPGTPMITSTIEHTTDPAQALSLAYKRIQQYLDDEGGDLSALDSAQGFIKQAVTLLGLDLTQGVTDPWD